MMLYMFPGGQSEAERKTPIPTQSGTLTYNGSSQSPTWNGYDTSRMTISGDTSGTNAGTYTVTFTIDAPYIWTDGTSGSKTVTWSIGKASQSFTLSKTSVEVTSGNTSTVTASGYIGTLSASSSSSSAATASVSGSTITITGRGNGYTTITVTASGNTNYLSASKSINVHSVATGFNDVAFFPASVSRGRMVVYQNNLHIFADSDGSGACTHYIYDGESLYRDNNMPSTYIGNRVAGALVSDNYIYLITYASGNGQLVSVARYDGTNWVMRRYALSAYQYKCDNFPTLAIRNTNVDRFIHLFGGKTKKAHIRLGLNGFGYNSESSDYEFMFDLPIDIPYNSSTVNKGATFIGTNGNNIIIFANEVAYKYGYVSASDSWVLVNGSIPPFKYGAASSTINNICYLIDASDGSVYKCTPDISSFSYQKLSYSVSFTDGYNLEGTDCEVFDGKLYAIKQSIDPRTSSTMSKLIAMSV